jgi:diguanylate cyclase (GGDEF)-like protein
MTHTRLLLVDDDEVDRKAVCRALARANWQGAIVEARDAAEARDQVAAGPFECILLDYRLHGSDGLALLEDLRIIAGAQTPIIMLTGEGNEMVAVEAMKRGAFDYLPKTMLTPDGLFRVISQAIERGRIQRELALAQSQLQRAAHFDGLTDLGNRNLFVRDLARAIAVATRHTTRFTLLMIDLDRFKAVNDTHGHEAGDVVLSEAGRRLAAVGRGGDAFYRLGGDEFAAIIDAPDHVSALPLARRIVDSIARPIDFHGHPVQVGTSLGGAHFPCDGANAEDLRRAADEALYRAKRQGISIAFTNETR